MKRHFNPQRDLFGAQPRRRDGVEKADLVDLELRRLPERDTEAAFCVQKSATSAPVYLPRQVTESDGAVFTFPRWLAVDRGLL